MKWEDMTAEELEAELEDIDAERTELLARAKQVRTALNHKLAEKEALGKLGVHRLKPNELKTAMKALAGVAEAKLSNKNVGK